MDLLEFDNPTPGTEPLPAFRSCGWNQKHVFSHCWPSTDAKGRRVKPPAGEAFAPTDRPPAGFEGRELRLEYWGDEEDEDATPGPAQLAAFRAVVGRQDELLGAIADALGEHYRRNLIDEVRASLGHGFARLEALLATREGVLSLLEFRAICLGEEDDSKGVAVGFYGNDPFDEEHGFGVLTRDGKVVEVGGSTTGWSF